MDFGRKISNWLWQDGIIPEDDMEIVQYGISQLLSLLLNLFTLLCICFLCGTVFQGMVFLVLFWPMRIYAGGYHANTKLRCYLLTTLAELILAMAWRTSWEWGKITIGTILLASQVTILALAPQENANKRIDVAERRNYRMKLIRILLIQDITFCIAFYEEAQRIYSTIICLQVLMAVLLVAGKWKNG